MENIFLPDKLKIFVKSWLNAKMMVQDQIIDPVSGTPLGGIISPTLANMTLNGLEKVVTTSIRVSNKMVDQGLYVKNGNGNPKRILIGIKYFRYADDFIVIARSKTIIINYVKPAIEQFLSERGLWLSPQKTKIFKLS